MKSLRLVQTTSLLVAVTGIASAQWTITFLHPAGEYSGSFVEGLSEFSQVGTVLDEATNRPRASIWSGTASSFINLHPAGANASAIFATDGTQHVGSVTPTDVPFASVWTGSNSSWTNLNPLGAQSSIAHGVSGGKQVGIAEFPGTEGKASLWSGTAESWVNLNPQGASKSICYDIEGNQQVGSAVFPGTSSKAGMWTGNEASWVSLHPGVADSSNALGTSGTSQVGETVIGGKLGAALWYGSAESWVDLSEGTVGFSSAIGVSGPFQVGVREDRASLWRGSASTWVNLHAMLPFPYTRSLAYAVRADLTKVVVAGLAGAGSFGRAVLWTYPIRRISGTMTLENTSGQGEAGTEAINWTLGCGSNTYTGLLNVNQLGGGPYSFEIPIGAPNGLYTLQFKGGTFLSSSYVLNLNGNNITRTIRLRNGDIDQDGEVGPGDFEAVVGQFGGPGTADADNDGEVGPSDFEIVVANFGLQDQ